jgi:hypothetical protein
VPYLPLGQSVRHAKTPLESQHNRVHVAVRCARNVGAPLPFAGVLDIVGLESLRHKPNGKDECFVKRLFNRSDDFAKKAGQSRSAAKRRAARKNGLKGGRRRTRTLAEYMLRRRIADYQRECVTRAFDETCLRYGLRRNELRAYFRVEDDYEGSRDDIPHTTDFKRPRGRIRQDVLLMVRIFRLLANEELRKLKPPRDYVVVYEPRNLSTQQVWEQHHPEGPPCPPRPRRIYFKKTDAYSVLAMRLSRSPSYPIPSAAQLYEEFGSEVSQAKVRKAIVEALRREFPRDAP